MTADDFLGMRPDERLKLLAALKSADRQKYRAELRQLLRDFERKLLEEDCLTLAVAERLGHEPEDGALITEADEQRAAEIRKLYPEAN